MHLIQVAPLAHNSRTSLERPLHHVPFLLRCCTVVSAAEVRCWPYQALVVFVHPHVAAVHNGAASCGSSLREQRGACNFLCRGATPAETHRRDGRYLELSPRFIYGMVVVGYDPAPRVCRDPIFQKLRW